VALLYNQRSIMRSRSDLSRLAAALGGLPILGCLAGSPAAEAGVRYGDILLSIDGVPTRSWDDFLRARSQSRGGFVARIFREGSELDVAVTLRPANKSALEILGELVDARVLDGEPADGSVGGGAGGAGGGDGGDHVN
jgi:membrane-associated protease RseP (regulator of RpoE activity)